MNEKPLLFATGNRKRFLRIALFFLLFTGPGSVLKAQTITTDKADYAPGETVLMNGTGFGASEFVTLAIVHIEPNLPDPLHTHEVWIVQTDENGNFSTTWYVNDVELNTTLMLTAEGLSSGVTASTSFTDGQRTDTYPSGFSSFTGGNSHCKGGTALPLTASWTTTTCLGTQNGGNTYIPITIKWYNSNGEVVSTQSADAKTTTSSFTPPTGTAGTLSYYVQVSWQKGDNCALAGSITSGMQTVIIKDLPGTPTASNNGPVCAGSLLTLSASDISGASYSWTGPDGFTSGIRNPLVSNAATASMAGIYNVKASLNGCQSEAASTTVIVNSLPNAPASGGDQTACSGSTLIATASAPAGSTVSWYDAAVGGSVVLTPSWNQTGTKIYYAESKSSSNCISSSRTAVSLTINETPAAPVGNSVQSFCTNTPKVSDLVAVGAKLKWYNSVGDLLGTSENLKDGTYFASQTVNGCESTERLEVTVILNSPAKITSKPADIAISTTANGCSNTASYSATISGKPEPSVSYSFSGATSGSGEGTGSGSIFNKGVTNVTITATNSCGVATASFAVTVSDATPPVPEVAALPDVTSEEPVTLAAPKATDNCARIITGTTTTPFPITAVGTMIVTWIYDDGNGNSVTQNQTVTILDLTPTIIAPPDLTTTTNDKCTATGVNLGTPEVTNAKSVVNDAPAAFPAGETIVTWTAINGSKTATAAQKVTVNDEEAPTIKAPADITVTNDKGVCSGTVESLGVPVTDDNCGVAEVTNDHPSSSYPVGTTTVTWTVRDVHGNSATATQTVTVNDTEVPTIKAQADITVTNDKGMCSGTVESLGIPVTDDNCGVAEVTNDHPSSNYPVGTTTVTWTVRDVHGNSATATQTVTVNDTEAPTIKVPADITVTNDKGMCSGTVESLGIPVTDDNCGVAEVTNDHPSSNYPVGTTTVTWSVKDVHGNSATATQTVTVNDTEAPAIKAPAVITVTNDKGMCSGTVESLGIPVTDDNCGAAEVTNDHPSSNYPVGTTTVTWTVKDIHGNSASATQNVTVTDNEKPTIEAPATVTKATDAGLCYATLDVSGIGTPSVYDNCGTDKVFSNFNELFPDNHVPFGVHTITWTVTDIHGNSKTAQQEININKITTVTSVTVTPATQQYSDKVKFTATVKPYDCVSGNSAQSVTFKVGSQVMGTEPLVNGVAEGTYALLEPSTDIVFGSGEMSPGIKTVTALFNEVDLTTYILSNTNTSLTISTENAAIAYNGGTYFTANPNNGSGTISLSATVLDDPDGNRGDIRNANLSFFDGTTQLGSSVMVGLIDPAKTYEGFGTSDYSYILNSNEQASGGKIWEVRELSSVKAGVTGYYTGESDITTVTLAMPGTDYVTGGGNIVLTSASSGTYPGMAGKKMNFGLVMKWNKSGKNLQGNINVIYRGTDGNNYQIKSNAISSLAITTVDNTGKAVTSGATFKMATITTKANIKQLKPDGTSVDLGGNATLVISAWESVIDKTGQSDRISVQLAAPSGSGIWFSSNWSGGRTVFQQLNGGKIQVQSAAPSLTKSANSSQMLSMSLTSAQVEIPESSIQVYPNPAITPVTFKFHVDVSTRVTLDLTSLDGKHFRIFDGDVVAGDVRTFTYDKPIAVGVYIYTMSWNNRQITGKLVITN